MKRFIVLTLLCIGIVSVGAIAASLNDPIRTLSQTEKANISAGTECYSCNVCKNSENCGNGGDCDDVVDNCYPTKKEHLDMKCSSGGTSIGSCGGNGSHICYKAKACQCGLATGGGWTCEPVGGWGDIYSTFDKDPC